MIFTVKNTIRYFGASVGYSFEIYGLLAVITGVRFDADINEGTIEYKYLKKYSWYVDFFSLPRDRELLKNVRVKHNETQWKKLLQLFVKKITIIKTKSNER